MDYVLSPHAQDQMKKRNISKEEIDRVLDNPHQIVDGEEGRKVYQSVIAKNNRLILLRVVIAPDADPPVVVSIYPTTQARYWR